MARRTRLGLVEISPISKTRALTDEQLASALHEYIALFGHDLGTAQFEQELSLFVRCGECLVPTTGAKCTGCRQRADLLSVDRWLPGPLQLGTSVRVKTWLSGVSRVSVGPFGLWTL